MNRCGIKITDIDEERNGEYEITLTSRERLVGEC